RIYYWFVFAFEDGSSFTSSSYWFDYLDNQIEWNSASSKWFEVYWSTQDTNTGEKIQSIALDGLKSATSLLPISPLLPIKIYVYPDTESLQKAAGSTSKESLSGTALLVSNTILVSTSTDLTNTANLERQIPHEITHLLEYQLSQANYSAVPAWLLEGLATLSENYKDADQARILKQALDGNSLIKLDQLCGSFPSDPGQLTLAYAESASFTQFLIQKYGLDKVTSMLTTSGNSLSCQQLVNNTFSRELNDLNSDWHNESLLLGQPRSNWLDYWPLLLLLLVLAVPLVLIRNHKRSSHRSGEDNDRIK
ncbi:MAG: peptidase MA family metallohydrolase, partial [Anaerolineaceae bacterium]|nr:peptidase MA family metallohydrolase [Anaerolineaceae bacterium]